MVETILTVVVVPILFLIVGVGIIARMVWNAHRPGPRNRRAAHDSEQREEGEA
jgi:hypothetical protein